MRPAGLGRGSFRQGRLARRRTRRQTGRGELDSGGGDMADGRSERVIGGRLGVDRRGHPVDDPERLKRGGAARQVEFSLFASCKVYPIAQTPDSHSQTALPVDHTLRDRPRLLVRRSLLDEILDRLGPYRVYHEPNRL